jgi:prepilin-type N-terminal cleavage/methylation domain-containing protein
MRMRLALIRRMRDERGFTLVEMTISLMLMLVVTTIFITVMVSVQRAVARDSGRSLSNDQARLAVQELDREIRSGNVLYDPSLENDPGHGVYPNMSLRIYTQSNAETRNPGNQCVQWRILNDQLQRRAWGVDWQNDGSVTDWRIVADNIKNNDAPTVPAFTQDASPNFGGRIINITIVANADPATGRNVVIKDSLTGRNTEYGYPNNICSVIPPY